MASFLHRVHSLMHSIVGKYFAGTDVIDLFDSTDNDFGVAFLNATWAYWGRPKHGLPVCMHTTAKIHRGMEPYEGWGCTKYTYNPDTGVVHVGALAGKIGRDGSLNLDGEQYLQTHIPASGKRYHVHLITRGSIGMCGYYSYCTVWTDYLALKGDGEFLKAESVISTGGSPWYASTFTGYPPNERGTYQVLSNARIRLSYASGKTKTLTFAVYLNKQGHPDASDKQGAGHGGVVLGTDDYYLDDDS